MTSLRPDTFPRPACVQRLGLLPPFSIEDVKKAYRQRAKAAHPDGGGDPAQFAALQTDYQRALCLAGFHESRRKWLADRVELYLERSKLLDHLEQLRGEATLQHPDHYIQDFGEDYAEILRELVAVRISGPAATDATLQMVRSNSTFSEIQLLDLSGSAVTDRGLLALADSNLLGLNLAGTRVSGESLELFRRLPKLEWLQVAGTRIGLWSRWWLRRGCPEVEVVADPHAVPPDFDSPEYHQLKLMQRLSQDAD